MAPTCWQVFLSPKIASDPRHCWRKSIWGRGLAGSTPVLRIKAEAHKFSKSFFLRAPQPNPGCYALALRSRNPALASRSPGAIKAPAFSNAVKHTSMPMMACSFQGSKVLISDWCQSNSQPRFLMSASPWSLELRAWSYLTFGFVSGTADE
jgi:hypothetical protein